MTDSDIPPSPSRKEYTEDPLYKAQSERNSGPMFDAEEPLGLFTLWLAEAREHEINDSNAMSLATVDSTGHPDVRIVLLKSFGVDGFVFYSNRESDKGMELSANPNAALCFHWKSLRRQVRIRGAVTPVSDAEADAYFRTRARESQIGAWASDQSRPVASREVLQGRIEATREEFKNQEFLPRPPYWGGWSISPSTVEFWRDRPYRLHDRLRFTRTDDGWAKERLFP